MGKHVVLIPVGKAWISVAARCQRLFPRRLLRQIGRREVGRNPANLVFGQIDCGLVCRVPIRLDGLTELVDAKRVDQDLDPCLLHNVPASE